VIRGTVVLVKKGTRASAIGAVGVVLAALVATGEQTIAVAELVPRD
jgi:hypothetical protein